MDLFHLFRTFVPLRNPIGFGAADFVELAVAALLVLALVARRWLEPYARELAKRTAWCMLGLAALPIALRLALLPQYPIPSPGVSDDFSYLLLADTLRHLRLANPVHPLHQFFETFFVLQEPSYSSIYPLGQGLALAIGWTLFGHPWAGVALTVGIFCALCYWMLRAWTSPLWALLGGLLAAIQFGPLNQWMNSYWGGAVSAIAGCLVFGSLPRLFETARRRDAAWLGIGLGLELLTRPFESIFLVASAGVFVAVLCDRAKFRRLAKLVPVLGIAVLPAITLTLFQNRAVTGSWTTLPYALSQYQYGVPTTFTVQSKPVPHRPLTREQELDWEVQSAVHGEQTDTLRSYWERFGSRVRFYRFFLLPPLYLALPFFAWRLRERRFVCAAAAILLFALGSNFYAYFYSHYIAAVACLFVLASVAGLERLSQVRAVGLRGQDAALFILLLCAVHFSFWYGLHASCDEQILNEMTQYETWDAINHGDPDGRIAVNRRLAEAWGKQLVFVRYWPPHRFVEWVHNAADMDGARVVWARDLGAEENEKLRRYYPDRRAWLLEPDFRPPRLSPYPGAAR